jgi:hypothetical protein
MIANKELSLKTQEIIFGILKHRKQVACRTGAVLTGSAILAGFPLITIPSKLTAGIIGISTAGVFLRLGKSKLANHNDKFRNEQVRLFRALRNDLRKNPALATKISKYKYLVVDKKGNIVGKNFDPRISDLPIGRRRVPNPLKSKKLSKYKRLRH